MLQKAVNICKHAMKSFMVGFVLVYLSYFLLFGKNGIFSYIKNRNELEVLQTQELSEYKKREDIKNKVERLYPKHLDADLLDEQYRRATGEIRTDEVLYYYSE